MVTSIADGNNTVSVNAQFDKFNDIANGIKGNENSSFSHQHVVNGDHSACIKEIIAKLDRLDKLDRRLYSAFKDLRNAIGSAQKLTLELKPASDNNFSIVANVKTNNVDLNVTNLTNDATKVISELTSIDTSKMSRLNKDKIANRIEEIKFTPGEAKIKVK